MSGKELYEMWVEANNEMNVGVDEWDMLDSLDQECWIALATKIEDAFEGIL